MTKKQEPPVLWALWNSETGEYDRYDPPEDSRDSRESDGEVVIYTEEQVNTAYVKGRRSEGRLSVVRLTPELEP